MKFVFLRPHHSLLAQTAFKKIGFEKTEPINPRIVGESRVQSWQTSFSERTKEEEAEHVARVPIVFALTSITNSVASILVLKRVISGEK